MSTFSSMAFNNLCFFPQAEYFSGHCLVASQVKHSSTHCQVIILKISEEAASVGRKNSKGPSSSLENKFQDPLWKFKENLNKEQICLIFILPFIHYLMDRTIITSFISYVCVLLSEFYLEAKMDASVRQEGDFLDVRSTQAVTLKIAPQGHLNTINHTLPERSVRVMEKADIHKL